ncbi:MAG: hypothetical protein ABIJ37_03450 [Pseudomonadota bacterium]
MKHPFVLASAEFGLAALMQRIAEKLSNPETLEKTTSTITPNSNP